MCVQDIVKQLWLSFSSKVLLLKNSIMCDSVLKIPLQDYISALYLF